MNQRTEPDDTSVPRRGSPLAPFRYRLFTTIWIATVAANIGTWMFNAAAGWLMTDLNPRTCPPAEAKTRLRVARIGVEQFPATTAT